MPSIYQDSFIITGVRGFRWATITENMPNRQPTACSTSSPPFFCFLGRQLEVAPFVVPCVATSSQLIAYPVAHRVTTSAVFLERTHRFALRKLCQSEYTPMPLFFLSFVTCTFALFLIPPWR